MGADHRDRFAVRALDDDQFAQFRQVAQDDVLDLQGAVHSGDHVDLPVEHVQAAQAGAVADVTGPHHWPVRLPS